MSGGTAVFVVVVAARLLVPLAIPRFPLPGIVCALLVDAVDEKVFVLAGAPPDTLDYQSTTRRSTSTT